MTTFIARRMHCSYPGPGRTFPVWEITDVATDGDVASSLAQPPSFGDRHPHPVLPPPHPRNLLLCWVSLELNVVARLHIGLFDSIEYEKQTILVLFDTTHESKGRAVKFVQDQTASRLSCFSQLNFCPNGCLWDPNESNEYLWFIYPINISFEIPTTSSPLVIELLVWVTSQKGLLGGALSKYLHSPVQIIRGPAIDIIRTMTTFAHFFCPRGPIDPYNLDIP